MASSRNSPRRILAACCGAHILHDGMTDLLYVLLPLWQGALGLSFVETGLLKTLFSGTLAGFQMPAGLVAERFGVRRILCLGTLLAGSGYLLAGWLGGSWASLAVCAVLSGLGCSVQHPLGSTLTADAFEGDRQRAALSAYNFSGDIGKMALPAIAAGLIAWWQWHTACLVVGAVGLVGALGLLLALPAGLGAAAGSEPSKSEGATILPRPVARRGFMALSAIGILDSATRTGFLTFLPFLLTGKGASITTVGLALSLVFVGGAFGKFVCGLIATRVGILATVILTETATAAAIAALLPLSLPAALPLLVIIGVALNGTTSVLYGTVAEFAPPEGRARAFGLFYTLTIGAGAIAPSLYGLVSDALGVPTTVALVGAVILLVVPLTALLRPAIRQLGVGHE